MLGKGSKITNREFEKGKMSMTEKEETILPKKKLLSPKIDAVFQVLFGEVGSEEITKEFLKAILNENITSVDLSKNPILRRLTPSDKMGVLDVIAKIDNKITCNIEMQMVDTGNITERLLYYWSRAYTRNIHKSEDYNTLERTIVILIANFEIKGLEKLKYFSNWKIIETESREIILTNLLELDIIELPKIYKNNKLNKNLKLLDWLHFLENPESDEVVKIMKENKGVEKAKEKLEEISNDEVMQKIADWKESYYREQASIRTTGRKEGIEEGIKEGLKEGKLQIAKNLKKKNMDINFISEVTGLSVEEIQKIN